MASAVEIQNSTDVTPLSDVIYSSRAEQVLSILFISSCSSVSLITQSLVLLTIIKSPSLHNVHFYIIATYCSLEIVTTATIAPNYLWQFATGLAISEAVCRSTTLLVITIFLGNVYHTGLIAFERYLYFCLPYRYASLLSTRRAALLMAVGYIITAVMCGTTEIMIGRDYRASILYCNLPDSPVQSLIQFMLILLPSAVITIYSSLKVWQLARRAEVAPHQAPGAGGGPSGPAPVKQALKALRMVLLLSGTLWGTIIPGYIVRIIVLNAGYTWEDLDTRRYIAPSLAMRILTFFIAILTSFFNPMIYYYSRKDLRQATRKLLGLRRVHPEASVTGDTNTGNTANTGSGVNPATN